MSKGTRVANDMTPIYPANLRPSPITECSTQNIEGTLPCPIFGASTRRNRIMAHDQDHHDHSEAEQNEIGGPVVLALFLFGLVILTIYFLS